MNKKTILKTTVYTLTILFVSSCAVTNNMYLNDATPFEKGEDQISFGIATGLMPDIDSVSENGDIHYHNKLSMAPNFYLGFQGGLKNKLDYRASLNLPYIIGGIGLRGGIQYSFLPKESVFNFAIGTDLGFVVSRDSIKLFGSKIGMNPYTKGITNADIFMPFTVNLNKNTRFTLTPRFIYQYFWIKNNIDLKRSYSFSPETLAVSAGLKYKHTIIELTILKMNNAIYPNFGIGVII